MARKLATPAREGAGAGRVSNVGAADTQDIASRTGACQYRETADRSSGVIARLSDRGRLRACKDGMPRILQRSDAPTAGRPQWTGKPRRRTRAALIRLRRGVCARIDPCALSKLAALAEVVGGAAPGPILHLPWGALA